MFVIYLFFYSSLWVITRRFVYVEVNLFYNYPIFNIYEFFYSFILFYYYLFLLAYILSSYNLLFSYYLYLSLTILSLFIISIWIFTSDTFLANAWITLFFYITTSCCRATCFSSLLFNSEFYLPVSAISILNLSI